MKRKGLCMLSMLTILSPSYCVERVNGKTQEEWVQILRSSEAVEFRVQALQNLGKFQECKPETKQEVIAALQDRERAVRVEAARWLGERQRESIDAIPALVKAMKALDEDTRLAACKALGMIGQDAPRLPQRSPFA